uniref:Retrotransposon protein, putative, unclassified n=1 Tax=Oryza sativa subsp. japonica TaxID=39947 RepID=Q2R2P0_ORYSJ|nr:retrotransposon protein, putative, unclassified [Oryza sativa Japonica Group]
MWKYGSALQQRPELNPYIGRGATSHNWHAPKPHRKTGFRCFERGREGKPTSRGGGRGGRKDAGDEEDGEAGAATAFRRNRGAAGGEDNAATSVEETATSIGVPATYRSRPKTGRYWTSTRRPLRRASGEEEVMPGMRAASRSRGRWWRRRPALRQGDRGGWRWYSGGNATGRRRERASGGHRAKRRAGRGRGGGCDAGEGDGTAGRRTVEEGEAAGSTRRGGKRRATAGRWLGTTGDRGRGLKRENGARGFHFIGEEREPATGEVGTAAVKAAGGHGSWPELARAFPAIGGTIQGGNWGN